MGFAVYVLLVDLTDLRNTTTMCVKVRKIRINDVVTVSRYASVDHEMVIG